MGLQNKRLLQQLLTQDHNKSLDDLFQLAVTFEAAKCETVHRSELSANGSDYTVSGVKNPRPHQQRISK